MAGMRAIMKLPFSSRISVVFWVILAAMFWVDVRFSEAGVVLLETQVGANNNGAPVSAEAVVATGNGTVTIDLTNTENPTFSTTQVLTGFTLTLGNGATSGNVTQSSADVVVVHSDGTIQDLGSNPIFGDVTINHTTYTGWTLGAGPYLSVFGTGSPNFGGLDYQTHYDANGSISGNSPHNPFSRGTIQFVMSVAGVTADTSVTGGTFQFGTNQNGGYVVTVPDGLTPVPEPGTLVCWCLLAFSAVGCRRFGAKPRSSIG
ncbi:MAG TPA: hypothetical protein VMV10_11825 [Pirellulales bacterium]|nr:hypothetical protein [Pirellulales bacterium]